MVINIIEGTSTLGTIMAEIMEDLLKFEADIKLFK
jgi:hypothetical protein